MNYDKDFTYLVSCRPIENNYKFFQSIKVGEMFDCTYGRIGASGQVNTKSNKQWRTKYRSSISARKGYIDRSEYFELLGLKETTDNNTSLKYNITNKEIHDLIVYFMIASNNTIKENYVLSDVLPTQKLFTKVQSLIDDIRIKLKINTDISKINESFLELISLSQRKISNVKYALFDDITNSDELKLAFEKIDNEQDLLDTLESQVKTTRQTVLQQINDAKNTKSDLDDKFDILKSLGLEIDIINSVEEKEIKRIIKDESVVSGKLKSAYKITNIKQQKIFDGYVNSAKNKSTKLLWHGSRTANYLSIIEKSLMIKMTGVPHAGSMFGDGTYFASDFDKSFGYTDSGRWVGGTNSTRRILLLFDVHVGTQKIIHTHNSSCYKLDSEITNSKKYDSVWAKKGQSLYRDEIIIYNSDQCTPKYIVEFE